MQIAGIAIVALGIIGIIWGVLQKMKAGRVTDAPLAPTGAIVQKGTAVCGPKGQISAQGNVVCQQPLIAPFSGAQCLFYKLTCTAEWKEGDTSKSKVLDDQKVAAQFAIDDGSGPVWVDAREGGDFEPTQSKNETKGTGIIGGITGTDLMFGNYRVQTGMLNMGTTYRVEEEVLPLVPRLYACGKLAEGGAIGAPSWRQLILSAKSRDELLSAASKGAKIFLSAGAAAFVIGSGLSVTAHFLDRSDAEPPAAAASVAAKNAPPAVTSPPTASAAPTETAPPPAVVAKPGAKGAASAAPKGGKPDAGAPKPTPSAKPAGAK